MLRTRQEILDNRRRLKSEYGELFDSTAALLFRLDPIGINFEENTDEYEAEVETILPRLRDCHSDDDVLQVVHEEFVCWFDLATAGPRESYKKIASEIWRLWRVHRNDPNVVPPEL
jgi:hypothetical protein